MKNLQFKDLPNYCITLEGKVYSLKSKRFLNTQYNDGGYETITLRVGGKTKTIKVHRLVAEAFIPNTEHYPHVNHKDGNKKNNHKDNLEWIDRSGNMLHAYDNNLFINKPRQLSEEDAHLACHLLEEGSKVCDVASMIGVSNSVISNIYKGENYKWISSEYDFTKVPKPKRYSENKILTVCKLLSENISVREIESVTKVHYSSIKQIKQRRTHTHLSKDFDW